MIKARKLQHRRLQTHYKAVFSNREYIISVFLVIILLGLRTIWIRFSHSPEEDYSAIFAISFVLALSIWGYLNRSPRIQNWIARIVIFVLKLVSPLRAILRGTFRRIRHDRYLSRLSPLHEPAHGFNRFTWLFTRSLKNYELRFKFWLILLIGGLILPLGQYVLAHGPYKIFTDWGINQISIMKVPESLTSAAGQRKNEPSTQVEINSKSGSNAINEAESVIIEDLSQESPAIEVRNIERVSFLELMTIGLVSTIVFLSLWGAVRFISTRPRHIVLRFKVLSEGHLDPLGVALTHSFVEHIQLIGKLLSNRQVENINIRLDDSLSLFVTNGQEEELIRQLSSWSDIEVSSVRLPIGRILSLLIIYLAEIRVQGYVQQGSDGDIAVWVEYFSRRERKSFEIERITRNDLEANDINEDAIGQLAQELAERLAFQLGHVHSIASSWESLSCFLSGLRASANHNWWHAISNYQRATEIEETARGSFGIGHYHIGATLLSQGEPHMALEHLQRAHADAPPNAETEYMLALTHLALNYGDLHGNKLGTSSDSRHSNSKSPNSERYVKPVDIILNHLYFAIQLSSSFPEAHHLLGIVYYQLARAEERRGGHGYQKADYLRSVGYFRSARREYHRSLLRLEKMKLQSIDIEKEKVRISQDQMIVYHHLGDALRSLGFFREAIEYYRDAQVAFPGRARNLVDQAMTFCQWKRWDYVGEFIEDELANNDCATWAADTQLYWGWATAGTVITDNSNKNTTHNYSENDYLLLTAFTRLDLALSLRPRFTFRRFQTDWSSEWIPTTQELGTKDLASQSHIFEDIYAAELGNPESGPKKIADQCRLWITWRCYSLLYDHALLEAYVEQVEQNIRFNKVDSILGLATYRETNERRFEKYPVPEFAEIIERLRCQRKNAAQMLYESDQERLLLSIDIVWKRVQICEDAFNNWECANVIWEESNGCDGEDKTVGESQNHTSIITFGKRWQIDVYIQAALFACWAAVQCNDFANLKHVSKRTIKNVEAWIKLWSRNFSEKSFSFNPHTMRYQLVTLKAWHAFADLHDVQTENGVTEDELIGPRASLNYINELQITAKSYRQSLHPLLLYVRARYYQSQGLHKEAINDFTNLLNSTELYDSRSYNPFDFTLTFVQEDLSMQTKMLTSEPPRRQLFYVERVSGQQQFEFLIDNAQIYRELADSLRASGDLISSVDYILKALTWSPYKDLDLLNFIELAKSLMALDMFDEASSVISEALSRIGDYKRTSLRTSTLVTLRVLECMVMSRLGNYSSALDKSLELANYMPIFVSQKDTIQQPDSAIATLTQNSLFVDPFVGIAQEFEKLTAKEPRKFIECFIERPKHLEWESVTELFWSLLGTLPADEIDNNFPTYEKEDELPEWLKFPAEYILDIKVDTWLQKEEITLLGENNDYERYMIQELRRLATKGAFTILVQACELFNNIAYNLAVLGIHLDSAKRYVAVALLVMDNLWEIAISIEKSKNRDMVLDISYRLAEYYDTLGWIFYQNRAKDSVDINKSDLQTSINILENKSLAYDQSIPVPHYHLSVAYISLAEANWQDMYKDAHNVTRSAPDIRNWLHKAEHHWKITNALDKSKRLASNLKKCKRRIDSLSNKWNNATDIKANPKK